MASFPNTTELRIGASSATRIYLRYRGIPDPDTWTFTPYSIVRVTGTGERKGYGFPTASWSWERLDQNDLSRFLDFFALAGDASVQVYISTYTDTGAKRTTTDYTAYMQRPVDGEGREMYPNTIGTINQNEAG